MARGQWAPPASGSNPSRRHANNPRPPPPHPRLTPRGQGCHPPPPPRGGGGALASSGQPNNPQIEWHLELGIWTQNPQNFCGPYLPDPNPPRSPPHPPKGAFSLGGVDGVLNRGVGPSSPPPPSLYDMSPIDTFCGTDCRTPRSLSQAYEYSKASISYPASR